MKLARLVALASCLLGISGAAIGAALPAAADTVEYVALGDSYSAGVGAGSYDSSTCRRSTNAYAAKWADAHSPASFAFVACAGATTADVLNSQVDALSGSTTLVSITIGGNDVGFADVMRTCVLQTDSDCLSVVATAESAVATTFPGRLRTLFAAIRADAPTAHVVVLGYPHLYEIVNVCIGLTNTKRTALNDAADKLDTAIATEVADAGFAFGDVRGQFADHELCSGDGWLNAVTIPISDSYHPTATGQAQGYLPVFSAAAAVAVS